MWKLLSRATSPGGPRGKLSVLFFHRVLPAYDPLLPSEPTPALFDAMLRWLRSQYTLLPLAEGVRRLEERALPAAAAAITFDDGYRNNLEIAAPVLKRNGVPATFFVTTDFLDGGLMWNDRVIESLRCTRAAHLELPDLGIDRLPLGSVAERHSAVAHVLSRLKYLPFRQRQQAVERIVGALDPGHLPNLMMDAPALRTLAAEGFDIGAHSCTHPILTQLPDAEAEREIRSSRERLQSLLGREVPLFAYPNGRYGVDFDDRHSDMVRRAGYAAAFTTDPGVSDIATDRWRLPRFTPWRLTQIQFRLQMLRNQMTRDGREAPKSAR